VIFKTNKYSRIYFNIIIKAKLRVIVGYKETHHIIPRSLGGSNDQDNLAELTAKEHYIVHLLLPHMVIDPIHKSKMWSAYMCMSKMHSKSHNRYTGAGASRFYEKAKLNTDFGTRRGIKQSLEEKQKRAESLKGHIVSEETRLKIGDANRGRKLLPRSEDTRKKLSIAAQGRKLSEESKQKISNSSKLRGHNGFKGKGSRGPTPIQSIEKFKDTISKRTPDWTMKPRQKVICPHCNKEGDITGMKRYHFDNCNALSDSSNTV